MSRRRTAATLSFPIICSVHGETLHNHHHANRMQAGDVMVLDSGVETANKYASDITRTIPVGGTFTAQQRIIYEVVLRAQLAAHRARSSPACSYRDVHLLAAAASPTDLKAAGLMKGDVGEAVAAGAHALFFPHGLGHMMGMDVHDMENIGEQYVGYEPGVERSAQFGLGVPASGAEAQAGLRADGRARPVLHPQLIDQWKAEKRNAAFINYKEVEKFRNASGYRIEDDVVVTEVRATVSSDRRFPKTVADVEAASKG